MRNSRFLLSLLFTVLLLAACAHEPPSTQAPGEQLPPVGQERAMLPPPTPPIGQAIGAAQRSEGGLAIGAEEGAPQEIVHMFPGTGRFVRSPKTAMRAPEPGDITLNFENMDIREAVDYILKEELKENYLLDPGVQGSVSLQTTRPLKREMLLPTLETLLRMNKAALVRTESGYQILPEVKAVRGRVTPQLGDNRQPLPAGYRVQIVPLRYIGAKEMEKILQPLASEGAVIRVDTARNLLVLAGAGTELQHLLETVEIFDVDWLAGMSVGLFTLRTVEAKTVIDELETVFGDKTEGPLAGLVRIIPIERLNALLVVTPQPKYLEDARRWIERLDTGIDITSARLYVYRVQNGRAVYLAELLNELFTGQGEQRNRAVPEATLAPGRRPAEVKSTASARKGQQQSQRPSSQARREAVRGGDALLEGEAVRIIADEENNALLILASPAEYQQIEAALRRLDVIPLQVLVEVSIIEVLLDDELEYGIQWFFNHHIGYKGKKVGALLWDGSDLTDEGGFGIHPGFNWSIVDKADKIIGILNMLAEESKVNILSSPSVLVLDNQTATIDVGDQVPILTSTTRASASDLGTTTSTIEYRDTGVRLTVTPRVNAGGLVTMEVEQEVSDVEQTTTSGIDSPTIQQRRISSTVAVQSRQTVVLGGLIRENRGKSKSGIPVLHTLPAVGPLFGQTNYGTRRTELVIVLTPQVVRNPEDARKVTRELREKLKGLPPPPPDTDEHARAQQTS